MDDPQATTPSEPAAPKPRAPRRASTPEEDGQILRALLAGRSIHAVAVELGCSDRRIDRWIARHRDEIARGRGELMNRASLFGHRQLELSLGVLSDLALDKNGCARLEGAAVRCRAAQSLVDLALRLQQAGDLEERIARLEERGGRAVDVPPRPRLNPPQPSATPTNPELQ